MFAILFAVMFLYGGMNLYTIWNEYRESEALYQCTQEQFLQQQEFVDENDSEKRKQELFVDFESLQAINEDVVGWIFIEDTVVNYPVMHSKKNNDEYLYTTYDGKQNKSGSIFVDYRNKVGFTDDNTVIYGHNMKNRSMFAFLTEMTRQEYYDIHQEFYIMTPEEARRYEVISVFRVDALSDVYMREFATNEDKQRWLDRVIKKSAVLAPFSASAEDTFVMLSTCVSGDDPRARVVAVGRLAEIESR